MNAVVSANVIWVIGESVFDMNDIQVLPQILLRLRSELLEEHSRLRTSLGASLGGECGPLLLFDLHVGGASIWSKQEQAPGHRKKGRALAVLLQLRFSVCHFSLPSLCPLSSLSLLSLSLSLSRSLSLSCFLSSGLAEAVLLVLGGVLVLC